MFDSARSDRLAILRDQQAIINGFGSSSGASQVDQARSHNKQTYENGGLYKLAEAALQKENQVFSTLMGVTPGLIYTHGMVPVYMKASCFSANTKFRVCNSGRNSPKGSRGLHSWRLD